MKKNVLKRVNLGFVLALLIFCLVGCGEIVSEPKVQSVDSYTVYLINIGIGSGESMLIKTKSGKAILIDAGDGGDFVKGSNNYVVNYLRSEGVTELEAIIMSHPHDDHISMMDEVINTFPVKEFVSANYDGPLDKVSTNLYTSLKNLVKDKGISTKEVRSGQKLTYDNLTLNFYNPPATLFSKDTLPGYTATNNNSLVFKIYNSSGVSLLFTGDIEVEAIDFLLNNFRAELSANIFEVPHHGSSTSLSPDFYAAVSPEVSIIASPGYLGLPNQTVVDTLKKVSTVYRSDLHGHITITVKNGTYTVSAEKVIT